MNEIELMSISNAMKSLQWRLDCRTECYSSLLGTGTEVVN